MATVTTLMQCYDALERANRIRSEVAAVKREVFSGLLPVDEALEDERAQAMEVGALLLAQRRWGPVKARSLLAELRISERRRVRALTNREKRILVARVGA